MMKVLIFFVLCFMTALCIVLIFKLIKDCIKDNKIVKELLENNKKINNE